jgi:hypothetical protein
VPLQTRPTSSKNSLFIGQLPSHSKDKGQHGSRAERGKSTPGKALQMLNQESKKLSPAAAKAILNF